jgi:hypothetical protein
MPIQVGCAGCGKQYTVSDDWAGKAVRCKACGATLRIPQPPAPAEDLLAQELGTNLANPDPMADLLGDLPTGETPLGAPGPALTSVRPKRRKQSALAPAGDSVLAFIRSDILNTAVAIGMGLVLLSSLGLLVTSGVTPALAANGFVFVGGFVIIIGGMRKVRRSRDKVSDRIGRIGAWFGGGIAGIVVVVIGVLVAGEMGFPVPSVTIITAPFFAVFSIMTLISGMILAYNFLVLVFPNMNVFRVAGWFYVFLTVVVPVLALTLSLMIEDRQERFAREAEERATARAEDDARRDKLHEIAEQQRKQARTQRMSRPKRSPAATSNSFDTRAKGFRTKFGAGKVVEVHLESVSGRTGSSLQSHILKMAGATNLTASPVGNLHKMVLAPVDDFQGLVNSIDFGEVVSVDAASQTIRIKVDPAKLDHIPKSPIPDFGDFESAKDFERRMDEEYAPFNN